MFWVNYDLTFTKGVAGSGQGVAGSGQVFLNKALQNRPADVQCTEHLKICNTSLNFQNSMQFGMNKIPINVCLMLFLSIYYFFWRMTYSMCWIKERASCILHRWDATNVMNPPSRPSRIGSDLRWYLKWRNPQQNIRCIRQNKSAKK